MDFAIYEDSVNILTDLRTNFHDTIPSSSLASYTEDLPNVSCDESLSACSNYWLTFPLGAFTNNLSSCKQAGNILPLKNEFTEQHATSCISCYREYKNFNFCHSLKPELIFSTENINQTFTQNQFVFQLPDFSNPTPVNDLDWSCFGSRATDCFFNSDQIEWFDNNDEQRCSWLSGNECDSVWMDRVFGLSGTDVLSACPNLESVFYQDTISNLTLLSGGGYSYTRNLNNVINTELPTIFSLNCIDDNVVVDGSVNSNDGEVL